jgi:glycosyltransferase involved in cell wall biosynthesis
MIVHSIYPFDETRVQRQAAALVDRGYEVDVICLRRGDEPRVEKAAGVTVYRLPVRRNKQRSPLAQLFEYMAFLVLAFFVLSGLYRRRRYHVVQIHNLPDFLVFAALIPKVAGSRVILDLHDLMPEFFAARFKSGWSSLPLRLVCWQEQLSCRFADHVITVSDHWRQSLIKRGVPAGKCSVLMNVADHHIFKPQNGARARASTNGRFHLIYHGTITYRYGLDLLLQAVSMVREEIPCIHLSLIGAGEYVETLRRMVLELKLSQHVSIGDVVPADQLPPLIAAADVGVVPYRGGVFTDELLPTKLMEYAALGVPAIASRTAAISAYFDATMVQFFTPGDANELAQCILALYRDRARLADLGTNIQKFNQRYNWASQAAQYTSLVASLAER